MLYRALNIFFNILYWGIILRTLISYFPDMTRKYYSVTRLIYQLTDPFMIPIENFTAKNLNLGRIDISPILGILFLNIVQSILSRILIFLPIL